MNIYYSYYIYTY